MKLIAPQVLVGRQTELEELAVFCAAQDEELDYPYMWWRAPAWLGKSALMSWFVLHPHGGADRVVFHHRSLRRAQ